MDFDKIKQNILNSSETSTSESISTSELHEEFEINNFLPEFEPLKLSGKNLAQQYVSAFNTGMNVYQCLNYLQGYVYTLVTAMNETIEAWNTVVPLLEQATKEWTDEEFDYKWSILKPQVIELVTNLTIETFNKAWEELKPVVIKLAQDTTDAEFKKQWDILKPQVITLVEETTTNKFNEEWEKLKPTIIQLSTDTTIAQFNRSWEELKPKVIELSQTTTSNKFDEKWEELRPQLIELAQTTTSNKFDEKWEELQPTLTEMVNNLAKTQTTTTFNEKWEELKPKVIKLSQTTTSNKFDEKWEELRPQLIELAQTTTSNKFDEKWEELQPTLTEMVNNLAKTQTTTTFNEKWEELKPQVIELAQTTTNTKFDEKWTELQPTLNTTVENLVNTNLETFKSTLWQEVTKNESFPFLLPENFGAVGDGETFDSVAFNNCFAKALETGKYVLLSNKIYVIDSKLNDITAVTIIGINSQIKLRDNEFCGTLADCYVYRVRFYRDTFGFSNKKFVNVLENTVFNLCVFDDLNTMFETLLGTDESTLLKNCYVINTNLFYGTGSYNGNKRFFDNTKFLYNTDGSHGETIMFGNTGYDFIFNNCRIQVDRNNSTQTIFITNDNLTFNNCSILVFNEATRLIYVQHDNKGVPMTITFNNCKLLNLTNKILLDVSVANMYFNINIINSELGVKSIYDSDLECTLWLENNIMDTKPIINSGTGKVNIVEIQQKYSDTSENIFPWTTEPTPTVENNVSLNKNEGGGYYVLTESKDKNIKKLDYYFKYNFSYLPNAPHYTNTIFVRGLDLEGYTVKRSLLNNNMCKLIQPNTDPATSELLDYVYLMLDTVTVTTTKDELQNATTQLAMKYLPYFAKLKTATPIKGQCYVDACISIILEKTSS
jgi:hypothetical protein